MNAKLLDRDKHVVNMPLGALYSVGQYFIFGALCPSKSGLMNKHIVKHTRPD